MEVFLQFLSPIIIAIIGVISVWIQTKHGNTLKSQKDLSAQINKGIVDLRNESNNNIKELQKEIQNLRKESKKGDADIYKRITDKDMNDTKRFLVMELTKISDGNYIPTEEQKRVLKECKDVYNASGGDSYVDDMYDDLRNKGLI